MVYYFEAPDFTRITGRKPHVGFADAPTRLVWITENEVFLEEVFPADNPVETTYVITAMYHDLFSSGPHVDAVGTQATYTRSPNKRPEFKSFRWNLVGTGDQ